jgi:hypothetical protein
MTILFLTNRLEGLDFYEAKGRTEFRRAILLFKPKVLVKTTAPLIL